MSGFFVLRREFLHRAIYRSSGIGFKILLDLVTSSPGPVKLAESPTGSAPGSTARASWTSVSASSTCTWCSTSSPPATCGAFRGLCAGGRAGLGAARHPAWGANACRRVAVLAANVAATWVAMTLNSF
jgi:hypothetical protein